MSETFTIHFGSSQKSKYFPQAIDLAQLAEKYEVLGDGENAWHIVTMTDDQIDLMASLYVIAVKVPYPKIYGADIRYTYAYCLSDGTFNYVNATETYKKRVYAAVERLRNETGKSYKDLAEYINEKYLRPIDRDMSRVGEKLKSEGRIDYIDPNTQSWVRAKYKPQEPVFFYRRIQELIAVSKYSEAVNVYYQSLGGKYYSELTSELIYLKRLAKIQLEGRDLLYFRGLSSQEGLIGSSIAEYIECIDQILSHLNEVGRKPPLELILDYSPTMEQMVEDREHTGYLTDSEFKKSFTPVPLDSFSATFDSCPEGRLFARYPDQVLNCRTIEYYHNPMYAGLWITTPPTFYQTAVLNQGFHLRGIDAYCHKSWRGNRGKTIREPAFISVKSSDEISKAGYSAYAIEYTGQIHTINGQNFYEVNLLRNIDGQKVIGNPLIELIEEVLREAENLLRERKGLPRIGEGWISETQIYRLVQNIFPDTVQHATPRWLKPQHLDVFVPSRNLAFEYQGKQHFEPVAFFGGQQSFEDTIKRDKIKIKKCKANGITLIQWFYNEPIDEITLINKIVEVGINIPSNDFEI